MLHFGNAAKETQDDYPRTNTEREEMQISDTVAWGSITANRKRV